jgi:dihydroorotate dehydrogenase
VIGAAGRPVRVSSAERRDGVQGNGSVRAEGPGLGVIIGSLALPGPLMNASGTWSATVQELLALARSATGAIVLRTTTLHPFLHPAFRSLHNPGYDRYVPLLKELAVYGKPLVASIAGAAVNEYVELARAFGEGGASMIEVNLAEPYVIATLAPWDDSAALAGMLGSVRTAAGRPLMVKCPERMPMPFGELGRVLADAGVEAVVLVNNFDVMEKCLLAFPTGAPAVVALGGVASGYDLASTLRKGATAAQLTTPLALEGPRVFTRIAREHAALRERGWDAE